MAAPVSQASQVDSYVQFVSATLMSVLGVNYYAIVWAFVGALIVLTQSEKLTRGRAIFYVLLSTFIGALLGTTAGEALTLSSRSAISLMSLLGGVGWQSIITLLLEIWKVRLRAFVPMPPMPPPAPPPPPAPASNGGTP